MATVQELKKYLNDLKDDEKIYIGYSDDDELECSIFSEEEIIDRANEKGGYEETDDYAITDVDTALSYLADMDEDYHFMEISL